MVLYTCKICNFSTNKSTNYNRHLTTKKHSKNVYLLSFQEKKESPDSFHDKHDNGFKNTKLEIQTITNGGNKQQEF